MVQIHTFAICAYAIDAILGLFLAGMHVAESAPRAGFVTPFADAAIEGDAVEILWKRIFLGCVCLCLRLEQACFVALLDEFVMCSAVLL